MDDNIAELLQAISEELDYYITADEPGVRLDSGDAERLITEAEQEVYKHDCSKYDIVGEPKPRLIRVRL